MKQFIFIVCLFITKLCFAESVALVLSANQADVKRNAHTHTLSRGDVLEEKDSITTHQDGTLSFKYNDGTLVNLGNDSQYMIRHYSSANKHGTTEAELSKGKLYSKTAGRKKEILKTPVMALAILGTEYHVYIKKPNMVYVFVEEGAVKVGKQIFVTGQSFLIMPHNIVEVPFPAEGFIITNTLSDNGMQRVEFINSVLDVNAALSQDATVHNDVAVLDFIECCMCM